MEKQKNAIIMVMKKVHIHLPCRQQAYKRKSVSSYIQYIVQRHLKKVLTK